MRPDLDESVRLLGLSLLPNTLTLGNLLGGFMSIVFSASGLFEAAAVSILVGAIFDAVDGPAARLAGTSSRVGAELDSLSDAVTFGVAPAVLIMAWLEYRFDLDEGALLVGAGSTIKLVLACAFLYCACAVLRLARFNASPHSSTSFTGLPSPAAALNLLSCYWFVEHIFSPLFVKSGSRFLILLFVVLIALSMVSKITFPKRLSIKYPLRAFFGVILITCAAVYQNWIIPAIPVLYWLVSVCLFVLSQLFKKPKSPEV